MNDKTKLPDFPFVPGTRTKPWRPDEEAEQEMTREEQELQSLPPHLLAARRRAWKASRRRGLDWMSHRRDVQLFPHADPKKQKAREKAARLAIGRLVEGPARNRSQTAQRKLATLNAMQSLFHSEPIALGETGEYIAWAIWSDRRNLYGKRCPTYKTLLASVRLLLSQYWGKAAARRQQVAQLKPDERHAANLQAFGRFRSSTLISNKRAG